jgi:hypothetical protein
MLGFYLLTKLSDIVLGCIITGIVSIFAVILATVAYYSDISTNDTKEEKEEILKHYHVKGLYFVCIIAWSLAILLPTTKQAAFIWVAPQIVENGAVKDTVKNIPELSKLATEYLKELLKEKIDDTKNI